MTDPPEPATERRPGTPRWVIGLGIALLGLILLAVVAIVLSGGQHGPGVHTAANAASAAAGASNVPQVMRHDLPDSVGLEPGATAVLTWSCDDAGTRGRITVG